MSCNFYQDMGFADPASMFTKSRIALAIEHEISTRNLTLLGASRVIGISRMRLRRILDGRFTDESVELLLQCLRKLGYDVHVQITPPAPHKAGMGEFHLIPPVLVQ